MWLSSLYEFLVDAWGLEKILSVSECNYFIFIYMFVCFSCELGRINIYIYIYIYLWLYVFTRVWEEWLFFKVRGIWFWRNSFWISMMDVKWEIMVNLKWWNSWILYFLSVTPWSHHNIAVYWWLVFRPPTWSWVTWGWTMIPSLLRLVILG